MSGRDYYDILGISREAKQEEIRRAYRKLARKLHPDVNKSKEGEEKFKEINEVHEVLKDLEKKSRYDLYGSSWQQRSESSPHEWGAFSGHPGSEGSARTFRFTGNGDFTEQFGFNDLFGDLFGSGRGDFFTQNQHSAGERGQSHQADFTISLHDAFHGASKTITLQSLELTEFGQIQPSSKMPDSINAEEEKLIKELARKSKFNPRAKKPQWRKQVKEQIG